MTSRHESSTAASLSHWFIIYLFIYIYTYLLYIWTGAALVKDITPSRAFRNDISASLETDLNI